MLIFFNSSQVATTKYLSSTTSIDVFVQKMTKMENQTDKYREEDKKEKEIKTQIFKILFFSR